jgi:hypothetical protein
VRLGCEVASAELLCGACGEHVLDKQAYHALCCAKGESTRGHNRVRNAMHLGFAAADASSACEVQGLVPSHPTLRPADILTQAAHPRLTAAVDVMVKSPNAGGAGHDCTEAGKREKLDNYRDILDELEAQVIRYMPAVFSSYGRRHPDVTDMMMEAARRAARQRGEVDHKVLLRRWQREVASQVWRRAANMVHKCLNKHGEVTEKWLSGEAVPMEGDGDESEEETEEQEDAEEQPSTQSPA